MNIDFGKIGLPFLLLVSAVLLLTSLHRTSIYSLDEAKNAECAREMMINDSIVPTFNGSLRTDKPPLHYFFMQASYKVFGSTPFSARLFSGVMGILTIGLIYLFALRHFGKPTAIASSLVLLSSVHFLFQMQMSVPDPYLIFLLTLASFSFYEHWSTNERKFWWVFYIAIGLGVLAKGPIAIALPGFTAFIFLILSKTFNVKTILRLNPFLGLLVSIAIAAPWYYLVHKATDGAFTEGFFLDHNVNRFSEGREQHGGLFFLTIAFVLLGFVPFIFFLPKAVQKAVKQKNNALNYLLLNAAVVIVFFMFSGTKLPNYTVPSYPALAIILGHYFIMYKPKNWQWVATAIFCTLLGIGAFVGLKLDQTLFPVQYLALFFTIPLVGAILAHRRQENAFRTYTASWLIFGFLFFFVLYPKIDEYNPVRKTADLFEQNDTIVSYKQFNPAFVFYYQKEIPRYDTIEELQEALKTYNNVKVISRKRFLKELSSINGLKLKREAHDIMEIPTTVVLEKQ